MRKNVIAIAAVMALGTAAIASSASAQQQRGGAAPMGGGGAPHASASIGGGAPHPSFGGGGTMGGGAPHASVGTAQRGNFGAATAPNGVARTAPGNVAGPRTNFAARGFDRDHDRFRHGHFVGPGIGVFAFGGPTYYDYYDYNDYDAADGCWQRRLMPTPYGLRWRLVDVCE